jgi:aerobic-type carbon monoxide dehydrogenase small subunit (CoxS/CutS family)
LFQRARFSIIHTLPCDIAARIPAPRGVKQSSGKFGTIFGTGGSRMKPISFLLNGVQRNLTVDDTRMLLWVLRDDLGLTGTKFGCGEAVCGACTVLINNEAVRACSTPMSAVGGTRVVTIEGLAHDERLHPVQEAFVKHAGFQCGYCTSGMIMGAHALLLKNAKPTRAQIVEEMEPYLCRCGAHVRIVKAIESASTAMAGGAR